MLTRHRSKQTDTLEERLAAEAQRLRAAAETLRPGPAREAAIRKASHMEATLHMSGWLRSPGLPMPT